MSALKTMKTAPRTWKSGREADVQSGRGRPARGASGKRKTSEKANVFRNLAPLLGGATSKSRPSGWRTGGKNSRGGLGGGGFCTKGLARVRPLFCLAPFLPIP